MNDEPRETKISGERLYNGRVVSLEVDRVRLADGTESRREIVRHPGATLIVPLLDDGRVVLVRQYRYGVGETLLEFPAGTLEPGEEPLACARRELAEETGYAAADWRHLVSLYTTPGFTDEVIHCYLARSLTAATTVEGDADERIELVTLPLAELRELARRGEIHDAKTLAALCLTDLAGG